MAKDALTSVLNGRKTVASSATPEALAAASTPCAGVVVQALKTNTVDIAVGATGIDASTGGNGILLSAGESIALPIDDLSKVYVDVLANGEGVRFTYFR